MLGVREATGGGDVFHQTFVHQADDRVEVHFGQTGVVEDRNRAVLKVVLPSLHREVTRNTGKIVTLLTLHSTYLY